MSVTYEVEQVQGGHVPYPTDKYIGMWGIYKVQGKSAAPIAYCLHENDAYFIANAITPVASLSGKTRFQRAVQKALNRGPVQP